MGMKLKINCDEATTICDKSQYNEASFMERVRLTLHLALCKNCKKYTKQNNLMSDVFNRELDLTSVWTATGKKTGNIL